MCPDQVPEKPEVTVVMIFLDEERFIAEAIRSVLAQTGVDWELLLVDDGSQDRSTTIAKDLATRYPDRIRYLTHPDRANRGMSASRNLGIHQARGNWLTFLDADDVWLPGKLSAQLAFLAEQPDISVLTSPARWWYRWDGAVENGAAPAAAEASEDWDQVLVTTMERAVVVEPPELLTAFLADEWRSVCDLVINTELARRLGGYDPAFTGMFEDQVFHAKVFATVPTVVTTERWYLYRQHPGACTAAAHADGAHQAARAKYLTWLTTHVAEVRPTDHELRRLVGRHRRPARHPRLYRAAARAGRVIRRQAPQRPTDTVRTGSPSA